jgi:hypothetical protein
MVALDSAGEKARNKLPFAKEKVANEERGM